MSNNDTIYCELFKPDNGQTIIELQQPYKAGQLTVYLNGTEVNYTEISPVSIELPVLSDSDFVVVSYDISPPASAVSPRKYGGTARFRNNQIYTVTIDTRDLQHEFQFTSRYSPMYSSARLIRSDLGDWLDGVPEDNINHIIYETSLLAENISATPIDKPIPYRIKQYVRYKSEINLLKSVYLGELRSGVSTTKTLGNLSIEHKKKLPELEDLLGVLQSELDPWEESILGLTHATSTGVVRAGRNEYDITPRRSF